MYSYLEILTTTTLIVGSFFVGRIYQKIQTDIQVRKSMSRSFGWG